MLQAKAVPGRLRSRGRRRASSPFPATGLGLALLLWGCRTEPDPPRPALDAGLKSFESYCAACHGGEGRGTQGGAPPLAGSPWVAGPESRLIRIVLHGLGGPLAVGEKSYNLEMPGFGSVLEDAPIAAILSFVRREYGGASGAIAPEAVARIRGETRGRDAYWTAAELLEAR